MKCVRRVRNIKAKSSCSLDPSLIGFMNLMPLNFHATSQKVTDYALAMTALHANYAAKIIELAENSVVSGEPINRPIWWVDPTDQEALAIDSGKKKHIMSVSVFITSA